VGSWDEFGGVLKTAPEWHPAWRRREPGSGSFVERGNLSPRCEGSKLKREAPQEPEYDAGHRDGSSP